MKKKDGGAEDDSSKHELYSADEQQVLQQEVVLRNGAKMRFSTAKGNWDFLLDTYQRDPELITALACANQKKPLSEKHLADLQRNGLIRDDGTIFPDLLAVFDAAWQEPKTDDEIPLRYPIVHEGRTQVDKLQAVRNQFLGRLFGHNQDDGKSP